MSADSGYLPYEKITDSSDRWDLTVAEWKRLRRAEWVVTEKIHGANFGFVVDAGGIRCANRKDFLREGDSFFGYETIRDALTDALAVTFARIQETTPNVTRVIVYGELFGGGYPHEDVTVVAGVQSVQTGVWYAPDIRFAAFDIRVEAPDGARYLDFAEVLDLAGKTGLPVAEPLFVGSYENAMDYPVRFDSTLPRRFGLPSLAPGTNPAEGVVVKPLRELSLPFRPVLKRKIPEFAEDRRFHEAEKWDEPTPDHGGALDMLKWEAYCLLTENRWNAAVSKVGPTRREEAFALFVAEVLEESAAAQSGLWKGLSARQREELSVYIAEEGRGVVAL